MCLKAGLETSYWTWVRASPTTTEACLTYLRVITNIVVLHSSFMYPCTLIPWIVHWEGSWVEGEEPGILVCLVWKQQVKKKKTSHEFMDHKIFRIFNILL